MSAATPLDHTNTTQGVVRYLDIKFPLRTIYDFIEVSRSGITKKNLIHLSKTIHIGLKELAQILHISERTLQRYALNKKLGIEVSTKVLQLAKLYAKGEQVFGDLERFRTWMSLPNTALGHKCPIHLLDTTFGFQVVNEELIRIEHGIFA